MSGGTQSTHTHSFGAKNNVYFITNNKIILYLVSCVVYVSTRSFLGIYVSSYSHHSMPMPPSTNTHTHIISGAHVHDMPRTISTYIHNTLLCALAKPTQAYTIIWESITRAAARHTLGAFVRHPNSNKVSVIKYF